MARSLLASFSSYHSAVVRSRWVPFIFVIPLIVYGIFLSVEQELTRFIIPFFPKESDKSFGFYNDFLHLCFNEILWLDLFLVLTWVFVFYLPVRGGARKIAQYIGQRRRVSIFLLAIITVVSALLVSMLALQEFANSADEYVYLYQAKTLSEGKLTENAHPLEEFFHSSHIAQKDGVSVGRFPPGWPLILSLAFLSNVPPFWINALLAGVTLLVFFSFSRRYYGLTVAIWSTLSLALTSYYIFNAASYFSHTACLLFTVGFVYAYHLAAGKKRSSLYWILSGIWLGCIATIRYYNALLFFIPVAIALAYDQGWKCIRPLAILSMGAIPFILFLMWYNYEITGDAMLPVTMWADQTETLGFVKGHTVGRGFEYTVRRILLFTYWCSPAILLLYFIFLGRKVIDKAQRFIRPEDYFLFILLVGYFFYHHLGGNQYGPRFLFEALPFAIVFVVSQAMRAKSVWPVALLAAGMLYAMVKFPYILQREQKVVTERKDIFVKVDEAGIDNAVVLISTHTGVIRPMPPRDLTRNHMAADSSIIYAEDRHERNQVLMHYYPDRSFYRYVRDPEKVEGVLLKIR